MGRTTTAHALVEAALAHLREEGGETLTVRAVAARAGVTHTTAYTYFSTRERLVAAAYWHRVQQVPDLPPAPGAGRAARVAAAIGGVAGVAADDPALARAGIAALLADDPEVARIRAALGADVVRRLVDALGPDAPPALVEALSIAFTGAMVQAGMGTFPFAEVANRLAAVVALLEG